MALQTMKSQAKKYTSANPIETRQGQNLATATMDSIKHDVVENGWKDFFKQLLGSSEKPAQPKTEGKAHKGDLKPGQELVLNNKAKPEKQKQINSIAGIDYRSEIVHAGERISKKEQGELNQKVEEIMVELKKLIATSAKLEVQFRQVTLDQRPATVGKYHLNFMEWLLSWVKNMRKNAQDAGAYLKSLNTKRNQRKYGAMAKKHGTSFTMSNERGLATQNG